ncbi:MAG: hypothetical protein KBS89_01470 [Bacteroidales bacterium]|nr:hypothetical protein [Candidatus Egerieousia equi]
MKQIIYLILALNMFVCKGVQAQEKFNSIKDTILYKDVSSSIIMNDVLLVKHTDWDSLFSIPEHPSFDSEMNDTISKKILNEINKRKHSIGDTLCTSDIVYCWKPYFEWLSNIDPHYSVSLIVPSKYHHISKDHKEIKERKDELINLATTLPVSLLNINDTILIQTSLVENLKKGDIISKVDGIPIDSILKYNFSDRHITFMALMNFFYFKGVNPKYRLDLIRNGKPINMEATSNVNTYLCMSRLDSEESTESSRCFHEYGAGYIKLPKFYPNNSRLFKYVYKEILKFKDAGYKSVIIDLRDNPGGSGHFIENFLSIFINKPEIVISKSEKVKVSKYTLNDNKYLRNEVIGQLVEIPNSQSSIPFKLNHKYFIDSIKFYIMMDQGTASTAAAFCNIVQYNNGATLVGEPLRRNAYLYGDIIDGYKINVLRSCLLKPDAISTTISELYSLAEDGILKPDIYIPYIAKQYSTGDDAMLFQLLWNISSDKEL